MGVTIYYWLSSREVFCTSGDGTLPPFLSSAANEDVYNGGRSLRMLIKKGKNILFFAGTKN